MLYVKFWRPIIFTLWLSFISPVLLADNALQQINQYRQAVGLIELQHSNLLAQAAKQHSIYLSTRDHRRIKRMEDAHGEQQGEAGFTGKTVRDRTQVQAYPHHNVSENISLGSENENASVELLMSGIYHRFGFLNFLIDEIGIGIIDKVYVYNMGRNDVSTLCANPPEEALAAPPHDCLGTKVKPQFWQQLCRSIKTRDVFSSPYKKRCNNGTLLNAAYMNKFCQSPPANSLLRGSGSYYTLCANRLKVKASWFNNLCENPSNAAQYRGDGRYYKICDPAKKVPAYWLKERCASIPTSGKYTDSGKYYLSCNNAPHKIKVEYMQQVDKQRYVNNPRYVAWPAKDMQNVDVAFYTEIPDPLPDLDESGYPFSLQFNPAKVKKVQILQVDFAYQSLEAKTPRPWIAVKQLRLLTAKNDPNKKLTPLQFAWFPLQKLRWGTYYRVRVKAKIDNQIEVLQWQFKTKSFFNFLS